MSDIGIFIIGCCVFGVTITATLVLVIGPSMGASSSQNSKKISTTDRERLGQPSQAKESLTA